MKASRRKHLGNSKGPPGRAFTLVELLVVIAIVTLLIALLMPALANAREAAFRIKCMSGERQVAMATLGYCDSNLGYIPTHGRGIGFQNLLADGTYDAAGTGDDSPATSGPIVAGGDYTKRSNFTSQGGCPYGPAAFSGSASTEYYCSPDAPNTSYGLPGILQTGEQQLTGPAWAWGPFRMSEKRLTKFPTTVALTICNCTPFTGSAQRPVGAVAPATPSGWIWNAGGGNLALSPLHTMGIEDGYIASIKKPRHRGEGLPFAFVDGHSEFIPRSAFNGLISTSAGYIVPGDRRLRDAFAEKFNAATKDLDR